MLNGSPRAGAAAEINRSKGFDVSTLDQSTPLEVASPNPELISWLDLVGLSRLGDEGGSGSTTVRDIYAVADNIVPYR